MRRQWLFLLLILTTLGARAQYDDLYKMEVGGGVGLLTYEGDFNGNIAHGMQPMASLVLKRVFSPYMGMAATLSVGQLKGSSANVDTYYPDFQQPYDFSHTAVDFGLRYEYNFWPYGTGRDYRGARRLTPFVFGGLGVSFADTEQGSAFGMNMPLGAGAKYKVGTRLNLSLEWAMHFTGSDKLDGVTDPYGIQSSGLFKNRDCYSALQLTLTYSFMPKCVTCNNDRDD